MPSISVISLVLLVSLYQVSSVYPFSTSNQAFFLNGRFSNHASSPHQKAAKIPPNRGLKRHDPLRMSLFDSPGKFLSRRNLLSNVLKVLLIVPLVEIITRVRAKLIDLDTIQYPDNNEKTTIVFHGSGGVDANTDALMSKLGSKGFMLDWYQYSKSTLFAAWNGQAVGKEVAKRLSTTNGNAKELHIIGVSVGGMAADACVVELKKQMPNCYVQETLLDPLCSRGIWDWTYGERAFGRSANYAQHFLNTDDPVPFTNKPLKRNCAVWDVTPVRPSEIFGHDWPLIYYTKQTKVGIVPTQDQLPRGEIVTVESEKS